MRGTSWVFRLIGWVSLLVGAFLGVPMVSSMAKDRDLFEFLPFDAQVVIEVDLQNVSAALSSLAATDEQKMVHSTWKSLQESYLGRDQQQRELSRKCCIFIANVKLPSIGDAPCVGLAVNSNQPKEVARGIAAALLGPGELKDVALPNGLFAVESNDSGMALLGVIENDVLIVYRVPRVWATQFPDEFAKLLSVRNEASSFQTFWKSFITATRRPEENSLVRAYSLYTVLRNSDMYLEANPNLPGDWFLFVAEVFDPLQACAIDMQWSLEQGLEWNAVLSHKKSPADGNNHKVHSAESAQDRVAFADRLEALRSTIPDGRFMYGKPSGVGNKLVTQSVSNLIEAFSSTLGDYSPLGELRFDRTEAQVCVDLMQESVLGLMVSPVNAIPTLDPNRWEVQSDGLRSVRMRRAALPERASLDPLHESVNRHSNQMLLSKWRDQATFLAGYFCVSREVDHQKEETPIQKWRTTNRFLVDSASKTLKTERVYLDFVFQVEEEKIRGNMSLRTMEQMYLQGDPLKH